MPLNEYLSTVENSLTSSNYVIYRKVICGDRQYIVAGKVTSGGIVDGVITFTVEPKFEYESLRGRWYVTQFSTVHKVTADDVIEFWSEPAAAVS